VPSDATAVVMNVTAVDPTMPSHVDVWPSGGAKPNVSNLNVTAGKTVANLVTAKVGAGGRVSIANLDGSVDVVADLVGYFEADPAGSRLTPLVPRRIIDTRADPGYHVGPLSRLDASVTTPDVTVVSVASGVPAGATAVVANVTAVAPSTASHLDVWSAGDAHPNASNLNFVAGQIVPNLVVVKIGTGGQISLQVNSGSVDVIVDIVGYYRVDPAAAGFVAVDPTRIADTRDDPSYHFGPLTRFDGQSHDLLVTGAPPGSRSARPRWWPT
jgi:hypothetical protein